MDTTQKTYRFRIEPDDPIATLEVVLATVRRLGIELLGLRTTSTPEGMEVQLRLAAGEEDPLTLCRMRLHNVVGILAIREMLASELQLREPRGLPIQHDEAAIPARDTEQRQFSRLAR